MNPTMSYRNIFLLAMAGGLAAVLFNMAADVVLNTVQSVQRRRAYADSLRVRSTLRAMTNPDDEPDVDVPQPEPVPDGEVIEDATTD